MLYKSDIDKNMFCYLGQNLAIATTVLTNSDKIICYNCYMKHNWVHISTISITILAITERPKLAIAKLNIGQIWTLHHLKFFFSTHKLTANSIVVQIMSNGLTKSFVTPILVLSQKKTKYMLRQTHNRPGLVITCTFTCFVMMYSINITNQMASIGLYTSDIDKNMFYYLGQN